MKKNRVNCLERSIAIKELVINKGSSGTPKHKISLFNQATPSIYVSSCQQQSQLPKNKKKDKKIPFFKYQRKFI